MQYVSPMRQQFVEINFQAKTLAVIEQANEILAEYDEQGFKMSLRQLKCPITARICLSVSAYAVPRLKPN